MKLHKARLICKFEWVSGSITGNGNFTWMINVWLKTKSNMVNSKQASGPTEQFHRPSSCTLFHIQIFSLCFFPVFEEKVWSLGLREWLLCRVAACKVYISKVLSLSCSDLSVSCMMSQGVKPGGSMVNISQLWMECIARNISLSLLFSLAWLTGTHKSCSDPHMFCGWVQYSYTRDYVFIVSIRFSLSWYKIETKQNIQYLPKNNHC